MSIENIKGIGPKTINTLNKLDIYSKEDLVTYYPYRYNFLKVVKLKDIVDSSGLVNGIICDVSKVSYINRKLNALRFKAIIENKMINVVIFNRYFMKSKLIINKEISIIGKYNEKTNTITASDIKLDAIHKSEVEPVYHLISGINNKQINKIITNVLNTSYVIPDHVPKKYNLEYNLLPKSSAIDEIHHPTSTTLLKQAKLKLIYEELFLFMFKMNYLRIQRTKKDNGLVRNVSYDKVLSFINELPFKLTDDQLLSVEDIYKDLTTKKRMNRLLLGDVGSGKTIICIIAMYINYLGGYQSVLMAPTEVLANQHYETAKKILKDNNIGLLVGSMSKKEKDDIIKKISNNEIDIVIGTHAILEDYVSFNNLGLVITDEQHRFGVNQRKMVQNKGIKTDILYASATPIPRTYALSLYGDMDLSLIRTKPNGRKEIITKVVKEKDIKEVLDRVHLELKEQHQIYVVAPLIDDEESDLNDINKLKDNFTKAFNKIANIEVLHGKMKKDDKNKVMEDFKNKKIQILISTTVIEVGVDVKDSTTIIIYNAERFGLATLHQLRGRVGRNDYQSYCYLICNKDIERLKVLEEANDGFYISEKDFNMRGQGDLFGIKQSGDMSFKLADIARDNKIMLQCKKDSLEYINNFDNDLYYQNIMNSLDINN